MTTDWPTRCGICDGTLSKDMRCHGCELTNGAPTPEQIAAMCAEFQAGWTPAVEQARRAAAYRQKPVELEAQDW